MFAVIKTGGKQYLVTPGQKLKIEKIAKPEEGGGLSFDQVLAIGNSDMIQAGKPTIESAKVLAEWLGEGKSKKVIVARYHSKTRYRKTKGHRQPFTEVLIKDIVSE